MSWSINKVYRNVEEAKLGLAAYAHLPPPIRAYIEIGLSGIVSKDAPVIIEGSGHLCYGGVGGGNYQETTCQLKVKPLEYSS